MSVPPRIKATVFLIRRSYPLSGGGIVEWIGSLFWRSRTRSFSIHLEAGPSHALSHNTPCEGPYLTDVSASAHNGSISVFRAASYTAALPGTAAAQSHDAAQRGCWVIALKAKAGALANRLAGTQK
jgi:hypothetical protein